MPARDSWQLPTINGIAAAALIAAVGFRLWEAHLLLNFTLPAIGSLDPVSWFGLIEMTVFVLVLLLGLAYVWRKGLLRWA